ncbi:MAPEG family protein [Gammaproteobacteria bacterium]|nr:MAPEG family protein [Gammaproteobacteria bacterium]
MPLIATPLYAGLLTLLYLWLTRQAISRRRRVRVAVGDGDDMALRRRVRAHGNFCEYVPLALLLLLLLELQGLAVSWLHALGIALLLGRLLHAWGISQQREPLKLRVGGMVLTLAVLVVAALVNIGLALT